MKKISVAVIVPRYLESIGGGAETLLKSYVDNIFIPRSDIFDKIEVITTCVKNHRTWKNELKAGKETSNRLTVTRFAVQDLDVEKFLYYEHRIHSGHALSTKEQFEWLKSGVNSNELYAYLTEIKNDFDVFLIGPYLFPISYWSAKILEDKAILVPCLHDERYAYQDCFRDLFKNVKSIFYNAIPEKDLAEQIYKVKNKGIEVGMGFKKADAFEIKTKTPYLLYSGRKETGKGLDLLIQYYSDLALSLRKEKLKLFLIGSGEINFLDSLPEGVIDLGFVSEQDKHNYMKNCLALVQPSLNESFSIVLMETWLQSRPVLVRKNCDVTKQHVLDSSGGLYFDSLDSFKKSVEFLMNEKELSNQLGQNGFEFVQKKYNWKAVESRMLCGLDNIL